MDFTEVVPIVFYIALSCTGLCLMKAGGAAGISILNFSVSYKMLAGMLCYGLSFLLYTYIVSKSQISILIPLLSAVNCCIIVAAGRIFFKEAINTGQTMGIAFVIVGTLLIGFFNKG